MWSSGSPSIGAGRLEKARRMAATVSTDTHVSGVGLDEASCARVEPQLVSSSVSATIRRATEDNAHPRSPRCQSGELLNGGVASARRCLLRAVPSRDLAARTHRPLVAYVRDVV